MCLFKKQTKPGDLNIPKLDRYKLNPSPKFDLMTIYEKCIEEMTLQQTKRDQIITVYLAMFSFVLSYILPNDTMDFFFKGMVMLAVAVIGYGFSLIIIRYRMYKEAYWICCDALTNLMCIKEGAIDKKTIQRVYYNCLEKKGRNFYKNNKFSRYLFFKKNIFSGETIYSLIHSFIVSALFGLSVFLLAYSLPVNGYLAGVVAGIIFFVIQVYLFFKHLISTYKVLTDNTNASFNSVFNKAWFLHLYID